MIKKSCQQFKENIIMNSRSCLSVTLAEQFTDYDFSAIPPRERFQIILDLLIRQRLFAILTTPYAKIRSFIDLTYLTFVGVFFSPRDIILLSTFYRVVLNILALTKNKHPRRCKSIQAFLKAMEVVHLSEKGTDLSTAKCKLH